MTVRGALKAAIRHQYEQSWRLVVLNLVVASGIKAVLNFSPGALEVPDDVKLKSVDLTVSLESLSFFLAQGESGGE